MEFTASRQHQQKSTTSDAGAPVIYTWGSIILPLLPVLHSISLFKIIVWLLTNSGAKNFHWNSPVRKPGGDLGTGSPYTEAPCSVWYPNSSALCGLEICLKYFPISYLLFLGSPTQCWQQPHTDPLQLATQHSSVAKCHECVLRMQRTQPIFTYLQ